MRLSFRISAVAVRFAVLSAVLAAPASAASSVIGQGRAHGCFIAALTDNASQRTIDDCTRALDDDVLSSDDRVATHVNRGILKMQLKQIDAAIADFDAALARDPAQPEAFLNKGVATLRKSGAAAEAVRLFSAAIDNGTTKPELAHFGRAIAHEMLGDLRSAYADLKQANALAPEWTQPVEELARYQVRPAG